MAVPTDATQLRRYSGHRDFECAGCADVHPANDAEIVLVSMDGKQRWLEGCLGKVPKAVVPSPSPATPSPPPGSTGLAAGPAVARAMNPGPDDEPGFVPASEVVSAYLVRPELDIEQAIAVWDSYKKFRDHVLNDEACFDLIEGSKEINRTGLTRLALVFGLSVEERSFEEKAFDDDVRYLARVRVSKGLRFIEDIGTARLSEIPAFTREKKLRDGTVIPRKPVPLGQREHFASARAYTRAVKRAEAGLLGGAEAD